MDTKRHKTHLARIRCDFSAHNFNQLVVLADMQFREIESLRDFARDVMDCWPEGDVDGGYLQEIATKHGLLRPETRYESCGDNCLCVDYDDFPQTCYRKTELLSLKHLSSGAPLRGSPATPRWTPRGQKDENG